MDPVERSRRLKQEADFLLEEIHLHDIINPYGEITPSGSYFLDVMAYPDIDLYIPAISIDQIFGVGAQIAACPLVIQVVFQRSNDPRLPGGLYLKPRIHYGDWQRPWKIDIWSLDQAIIDAHMEEMRHFSRLMTPELRQRILTYKNAILNSQHRTPMHSGYFIYKAFIDEGLTDFYEVSQYLKLNGIVLNL